MKTLQRNEIKNHFGIYPASPKRDLPGNPRCSTFLSGGGIMAEDLVGVVINFYARPGVAAVKVTGGSIKTGDILKFKGHTTDFTEEVASIEIEKTPVDEAKTGDLAGVKVKERVRENDRVYKVVKET
jgi:hypothetical protein